MALFTANMGTLIEIEASVIPAAQTKGALSSLASSTKRRWWSDGRCAAKDG